MIQILPTVFSKEAVASDGPMQRVYTPLELAGRDIYVREGCYNCHSQMIRPLVGEVLRYGKSGQLTESIYDFPFQWGSKRTGPDLQRQGGKYPNLWHFQHMLNPRTTSIGSNMPAYPWLYRQTTDLAALPNKIDVLRKMGVPFPAMTPEEIQQVSLEQGQAIVDDLGKNDIRISPDKEIIALIAYLQQLGKYEPKPAAPAAPADKATASRP
jgi:cytochrome c oxidase cbb3-type subunit I/II